MSHREIPMNSEPSVRRSNSSAFSSTATLTQTGSGDVFIKLALDQLQNAKESKKLPALKDAAKSCLAALEANSHNNSPDDLSSIKAIFKPFQIACQSRQPALVTISVDCLGKLFSYDYWAKYNIDSDENTKVTQDMDIDGKSPRSNADEEMESGSGIVAIVIDTICDCFSGGENTDDKVQLQIVKALLAAVTSDTKSAIHGGGLLKAVRTTYNIFLLSKSSNTQIVAQATLTQMVQAVFGRVPKDSKIAKKFTAPAQSPESSTTKEKNDEQLDSVDKNSEISNSESGLTVTTENNPQSPTTSISSTSTKTQPQNSPGQGSLNSVEIVAVEMYIKDAYLVFRALCKLSMKPIPAVEGPTDLKSHSMRSKLLSLHLINSILTSHLSCFFINSPCLFTDGTDANDGGLMFIHAVKQYLCLSLSRNAVSVVPQVFDISIEIFGKVLIGLRTVLRKEISVLISEIIIPILEARSSITFHQRSSLLRSLSRILSDPNADGGRVLVELYLNYDCNVEGGARENIWERLISALSKVNMQYADPNSDKKDGSSFSDTTSANGQVPPAMTTATLVNFTKEQVKEMYSSSGDTAELKKRGLDVLVKGILKPLVTWCASRGAFSPGGESFTNGHNTPLSPVRSVTEDPEDDDKRNSTSMLSPKFIDDPTAFETLKHRKQLMTDGIKRFNFKPKKGIQFLLESGCIASKSPQDIAQFLLNAEGLDKTQLGDYLGEGDDEHIAIMHAFVDEMDFTAMAFTEALRMFLQSFRLPGEAQKIDRFMLKFAERFLKNNPGTFSSADTAYVLAYSVIMLNTDQHNTQVKKRMSKQDFLKNNRGIDEGKDLDPVFLEQIFDEISTNEIIMKDEVAAASNASGSGPARSASSGPLANSAITAENLAMKTETMFTTLMQKNVTRSATRKGLSNSNSAQHSREGSVDGLAGVAGVSSGGWYAATQYEHVRGMFQTVWMSILTGLSSPLQETEDMEVILVSLEGFKLAIRIACQFDTLGLERKAFLSTLAKFTQFAAVGSNLQDVKSKNIEAVKALLEIAHLDGNSLGENWKDVVTCVSQLEKLQLLGGAESELAGKQRTSNDRQRRESAQNSRSNAGRYLDEAAAEASSQSMTIAVDRIFTSSVKLSGPAIVAFVRALSQTSWDEIVSSAGDLHPRMYCLQRLVEISYYNMKRIRYEWSQIWAIMGEHFNKVGSLHVSGAANNSTVAFFALDKLRQLAMKFLDMEELPNFKFQKDFLKPFEIVLGNNPDVKIKDMVLVCLQQMIQAKAKSMKSGWKTMFATFQKAAKESHEPVVLLSFDILKMIYKTHFESVVANGSFPDFIGCLVEFCKNRKVPKTSLHAIELLRQSIGRLGELIKTDQANQVANTPTIASIPSVPPEQPANIPLSQRNQDDPNYRFWFPVLFGLYEIIMTCDLEVRTRGLTYLFDTLKTYGKNFTHDFWEVLSKGVLFPIFDDLKLSRKEHSKFANKEDMSVWLSTTMIQALRQFVDLFAVYFEQLSFLVEGLLELLTVCMTQENETLARIGSTCLQQFIEANVFKLDKEVWDRICAMFVNLFEITTPDALFFDLVKPDDDTTPYKPPPEKKDFQQIIVKCVLHLLVIQTLSEVLTTTGGPNPSTDSTAQQSESQTSIDAIDDNNNNQYETAIVYRSLTSSHLFDLLDCLERSYTFARKFNSDLELRMQLYKMGFMKQLPNLLRQETSSVSTYIMVMVKMHSDPLPERMVHRSAIENRLIPLCLNILIQYNTLDPESKRRNVNAWRPVVVTILNAIVDFDEISFRANIAKFYAEVVHLLMQEVPPDIRVVLHALLVRAGVLFGVIAADGDDENIVGGMKRMGSLEHSVDFNEKEEEGAGELVPDMVVVSKKEALESKTVTDEEVPVTNQADDINPTENIEKIEVSVKNDAITESQEFL
ncbi:guanine nucleotide exchange protein for ADP-robosylation factor [Nowakowskiella sp. JEL0407]|nr:guanine nucleotide exchange protein for ADP-robosylation factor [Nowakowskiella sp. JEL0407]